MDRAHGIALETAEAAVGGAAPMLGEHARCVFLPPCGRRGGRALGGLEERGGDHATGVIIPIPAGSETRIVGHEPHDGQHERGGEASERNEVDRAEGGGAPGAAQEKDEQHDTGRGEGEVQQVDVGDQTVVRMITRSAPDEEPSRHHADDDQVGTQSHSREEVGGARAEAQAGPDPDEQDAQGEKRRLALDRRVPGPYVAKAGQAGQYEQCADE